MADLNEERTVPRTWVAFKSKNLSCKSVPPPSSWIPHSQNWNWKGHVQIHNSDRGTLAIGLAFDVSLLCGVTIWYLGLEWTTREVCWSKGLLPTHTLPDRIHWQAIKYAYMMQRYRVMIFHMNQLRWKKKIFVDGRPKHVGCKNAEEDRKGIAAFYRKESTFWWWIPIVVDCIAS